jgi:cytochrome c551/c552
MRAAIILFSFLFIICFAMCGENPNPPVSSLPTAGAKNAHAEGASLFRMYCASCHNPHKDLTGPALKGSSARVPNKDWMYAWVKNPQALIDAKDEYALMIYEAWKPAVMNGFPNMTNEQIDAIMDYVEAQ